MLETVRLSKMIIACFMMSLSHFWIHIILILAILLFEKLWFITFLIYSRETVDD